MQPGSRPASGRSRIAAPMKLTAEPMRRVAVGGSRQTRMPSRPETMGAIRKPPTAFAMGTMPSAAMSAVIAPMMSAVRTSWPTRSPWATTMRRPVPLATRSAIRPAEK